MFKKIIPIVLIVLMPAFVLAWPMGWDSVGVALVNNGHGSYVVTEDGIFSVKHLVEEGSKPVNFKVVKKYRNKDLIKIKVIGTDPYRYPAPVAKYIDPDKPVYFIGFIGYDQKVVRYGHIMGRVTKLFDNELRDHILIDMVAVPGMSGGGVFQNGKVIGVVSLGMVYEDWGGLYSAMVPLPGVKWLD